MSSLEDLLLSLQDSFENNMKKFERIFLNFPLLRTFELMNDVIHGPLVDMHVHGLSVALSAWTFNIF